MTPSGEIIGYRRVSSASQKLDRQELAAVTGRMFEEKLSGASKQRPALQEMIAYIREGDEVHVHSIDRLARSLRDLEDIVAEITSKGASIRFLKEGMHFQTEKEADPFQRLMFQMLGSFAEFERALILGRQKEGIAKAKDEGKFTGRKPSLDHDFIYALSSHMSADKVAKALDVGRASVFRINRTMKEKGVKKLNAEWLDLIKSLRDDPESSSLLEQAKKHKELHNRVWSFIYENDEDGSYNQPSKIYYLSNQGWSTEAISKKTGIEVGYVQYTLDNPPEDTTNVRIDGLFK